MSRETLFISIDGMTDPLGQSQVIPYLLGLAKRGYPITLISCEKPNNFSRNERTVREQLDREGIRWKYCFYSNNLPFISQRRNLRRLRALAFEEAHRCHGQVTAHCRSYLPALIGAELKKRLGARFLFDMRGFWADERVEGGIWNLKNPVHRVMYNYFKRKENELLQAADQIVTLSARARDVVAGWCGAGKAISVIPCCADLDHFTSRTGMNTAAVRDTLSIALDSYVWGYLGSLGTWYMLDEMLALFARSLIQNKNSVFLFVTPDAPGPIFQAASHHGISPQHIRVRAASRKEVPALVSVFNAGIFFIRPTFSKKGSSPTKMAELLACGVPIITNTGIGDCDQVIADTGCGLTVDAFSDEAYDKLLARLPQLGQLTPDGLRQVANTYFSLETGIAAYEAIYSRLRS